MIKKIRIRLALINATLIFVMLMLLGGSLYAIMRQRMFTQFDKEMSTEAQPITLMLQKGRSPAKLYRGAIISNPNGPEALRLPLAMFLWNRAGKLVSTPPTFISRQELQVLKSHRTEPYATVTLGNHHFRVINLSIVTPTRRVTFQLVRNMDQLLSTLHDLFILLVVGTIGVLLIATASGFALADRALVPIRKSWRRQTQFVADVSHELRTPLMAIQARTELLLRNPEQTIDESLDAVGDIYQETKRVSRMVESLLTLARSDSNQLELELAPTAIHELLEHTVASFRPLCAERNVTLSLTCAKDLIYTVDEGRIRQLLYILLDNALKYNRPGGNIEVICSKQGKGIEVVVRDTGIGISSKDLPHIFERFYRADKARSGGTAGAGLGLAMAKWIVTAHKGQIEANSRPGNGTSITLSL